MNTAENNLPPGRPAWSAVFSMALCVMVLIASEFMPVSLLTPIAKDLGLTEGQAGQAISISGIFAVITGLGITRVAGDFDRRRVLLAPNFLVLMTGRTPAGHRHRWLLVHVGHDGDDGPERGKSVEAGPRIDAPHS